MRGRTSPAALAALAALAATGAGACGEETERLALESEPAAAVLETEVVAPEPRLRRLTRAQYRNVVRDLLGEDAPLPSQLEPDVAEGGLFSVGASLTTVSAWGVEKAVEASYQLATWALEDPARRAALVPCQPKGAADSGCAEAFVRSFGRRAWRRPLEDEEVDGLVAVAGGAGETLGDFHAGLAYALAAVLQSPHFLYRVELGEPDPDRPGARRFTGYETASRLSFLLWDTAPDDALLDAAESGALTTDAGVLAEVDRLLASPLARRGVRTFFSEWFRLDGLDDLKKDPTLFLWASPELGPDAREETLRTIEHLVFDAARDVRDLLTTRTTFVNARLASLYDVPLPSAEPGFHEVVLPVSGGRRGLLGQASILSMHAHAVSSSATRRGKFVRETLLCGSIDPPPADVDTSLPEPSEKAPTLRERVASHLTVEFCAGCHLLMDPIGLGLENFDGVGRWRDTELGAPILPHGDVDGAEYADAWELAGVVRNHADLAPCLVRQLYRYAGGRIDGPGDDDALLALEETFASHGHRFLPLLRTLATSRAFRTAGEVLP